MPDIDAYEVPSAPNDPDAEALEVIVRPPADILHTDAFMVVGSGPGAVSLQ